MFQHQGMWLPDGEKHFPSWMDKNGELVDGRGTYQLKKWRACLPWIKSVRVAVDVGAHVGFWSIRMCEKFEFVHCFEPMEPMRACLFENMKWHNNFCVHPKALGERGGLVFMNYDPADSGNTHIGRACAMNDDDPSSVEVCPLDELALERVDFIKVDTEGSEAAVLKGAAETLRRWKPCVIVEQKQRKMAVNYGTSGTPAVDVLREMGAVLRQEIGGDYILSWPDAA
jgi:FkbM family methyltransferase